VQRYQHLHADEFGRHGGWRAASPRLGSLPGTETALSDCSNIKTCAGRFLRFGKVYRRQAVPCTEGNSVIEVGCVVGCSRSRMKCITTFAILVVELGAGLLVRLCLSISYFLSVRKRGTAGQLETREVPYPAICTLPSTEVKLTLQIFNRNISSTLSV
jgi:hypothetical protein